jgi:hypothetical protein
MSAFLAILRVQIQYLGILFRRGSDRIFTPLYRVTKKGRNDVSETHACWVLLDHAPNLLEGYFYLASFRLPEQDGCNDHEAA